MGAFTPQIYESARVLAHENPDFNPILSNLNRTLRESAGPSKRRLRGDEPGGKQLLPK